MTVSEMKTYLGSYRRLVGRANRLSQDISSFPGDSSFLTPLLNQVTKKSEDIANKVMRVENFDKREILIRKYINGETLEEIGTSMGYSPRHVQRLINNAVETMEEVRNAGQN